MGSILMTQFSHTFKNCLVLAALDSVYFVKGDLFKWTSAQVKRAWVLLELT